MEKTEWLALIGVIPLTLYIAGYLIIRWSDMKFRNRDLIHEYYKEKNRSRRIGKKL